MGTRARILTESVYCTICGFRHDSKPGPHAPQCKLYNGFVDSEIVEQTVILKQRLRQKERVKPPRWLTAGRMA